MTNRVFQSEEECVFCKLIKGEIPRWIINETDKYIAFLTPFPNTPGVVVAIPKEHKWDYVFDMEDKEYCEYMKYIKKVVHRIDKVFGVSRTALVFEGTQVSHVHAKLFPLHGDIAGKIDVDPDEKEFIEEYRGYLTTLGGPKMDDGKLDELRDKLKF
jgi:diadenosine tetraphosphate (Ap4A) HIT family hydrolase